MNKKKLIERKKISELIEDIESRKDEWNVPSWRSKKMIQIKEIKYQSSYILKKDERKLDELFDTLNNYIDSYDPNKYTKGSELYNIYELILKNKNSKNPHFPGTYSHLLWAQQKEYENKNLELMIINEMKYKENYKIMEKKIKEKKKMKKNETTITIEGSVTEMIKKRHDDEVKFWTLKI